mgnify:CR=1 FL=1
MKKYCFSLFVLAAYMLNAFAQVSQLPFADPFVLLDDGVYYSYGTHSGNGIEVYSSSDLRSWKYGGLALSKNNTNETQWFWAPEVYRVGDKYHMYYSANEHLYVAIADSPKGPFIQHGPMMMWNTLASEKCIDSSVFFDDDGKVSIFATSLESMEAAKKAVGAVSAVAEPGRIYEGTVTGVKDFGAFVELADHVDGLLHVSQIQRERVEKPSDVLQIGQVVTVKITGLDLENQKISLSMKALLPKPERRPRADRGGNGNRRQRREDFADEVSVDIDAYIAKMAREEAEAEAKAAEAAVQAADAAAEVAETVAGNAADAVENAVEAAAESVENTVEAASEAAASVAEAVEAAAEAVADAE